MLAHGSVVELNKLGVTCMVEKLLGEGGQGAVFEARQLSGSGAKNRFALKWYLPRSATQDQWNLLSELVELERPPERFLWPIDIATAPDQSSFGYVMPLRPPEYYGMAALLSGKVDLKLRELATVGLELADSFLALHTQGLCYRDISHNNVFFRAKDGRVLICDTDNVGIDRESPGNVTGTPYYMAPEVMREDTPPSTTSDQFSLAILLFYIFMLHHPLEGKRALDFDCWDRDAQMEVFARHPLFIFDPDDSSNRPVPDHHDNVLGFWPIYPQFLRDRFTHAFTAGIHDPVNGRVQESTWRTDMVRLRDAVVYCPSCQKQNFYDEKADTVTCWSCKRSVVTPLRLRIDRNRLQTLVMLNHDAKIYAHHVRGNYDFGTSVAEVVKHPSNPNRWGLRNLSTGNWSATDAEGRTHMVSPGRSVALVPRMRIEFGTASAEVLWR